jgi:hypothetical protein
LAEILIRPSGAMATLNAAADKPGKTDGADKVQKSKPEKPDEQHYKDNLAKAEKEHAIAQEKVVRQERSLSHNKTLLNSAAESTFSRPI